MPHGPRIALPGLPAHFIQRGNNRQACFYAEEDYRRYLDWLGEYAGKSCCRVHAYVNAAFKPLRAFSDDVLQDHACNNYHPCYESDWNNILKWYSGKGESHRHTHANNTTSRNLHS